MALLPGPRQDIYTTVVHSAKRRTMRSYPISTPPIPATRYEQNGCSRARRRGHPSATVPHGMQDHLAPRIPALHAAPPDPSTLAATFVRAPRSFEYYDAQLFDRTEYRHGASASYAAASRPALIMHPPQFEGQRGAGTPFQCKSNRNVRPAKGYRPRAASKDPARDAQSSLAYPGPQRMPQRALAIIQGIFPSRQTWRAPNMDAAACRAQWSFAVAQISDPNRPCSPYLLLLDIQARHQCEPRRKRVLAPLDWAGGGNCLASHERQACACHAKR